MIWRLSTQFKHSRQLLTRAVHAWVLQTKQWAYLNPRLWLLFLHILLMLKECQFSSAVLTCQIWSHSILSLEDIGFNSIPRTTSNTIRMEATVNFALTKDHQQNGFLGSPSSVNPTWSMTTRPSRSALPHWRHQLRKLCLNMMTQRLLFYLLCPQRLC